MDRDPSPESTFALLVRHRAGDEQALALLIDRYHARVERIVRVRVGPALLARETVSDVVQDVFVRILEGLETYEERSDARWIDWVARLAQNEIANHARSIRAQKRGGALAEQVRARVESAESVELVAESSAVHSKVARKEMIERVDRCVGELSEAHREVILLRDYAGGDWKTVSEQMGRASAEACQELHRRARRELEKRFRELTA